MVQEAVMDPNPDGQKSHRKNPITKHGRREPTVRHRRGSESGLFGFERMTWLFQASERDLGSELTLPLSLAFGDIQQLS